MKKSFICFLFFIIVLSACSNFKRDNPLDPEGIDFDPASDPVLFEDFESYSSWPDGGWGLQKVGNHSDSYIAPSPYPKTGKSLCLVAGDDSNINSATVISRTIPHLLKTEISLKVYWAIPGPSDPTRLEILFLDDNNFIRGVKFDVNTLCDFFWFKDYGWNDSFINVGGDEWISVVLYIDVVNKIIKISLPDYHWQIEDHMSMNFGPLSKINIEARTDNPNGVVRSFYVDDIKIIKLF